MKKLLLMLCIPVAVVMAQAPSDKQQMIVQLDRVLGSKGQVLLHVDMDSDGTQKYYAISAEHLAQSPTWDGNGEVPLDLNKATLIAREHLTKQHPEHKLFPLSSGRIFPIDNKVHANRWCYALEFRFATKTSQQIDSAVLSTVKINNQALDLPDKLPIERTECTTLQVFIMLDGSIIQAKTAERKL